MPVETVLSSYILRLTRKRNRLQVGLQDVRSGSTLHFESIEALIAHLEQLNINLDWNLAVEQQSRAPPDDDSEPEPLEP
jgi:hypothetical protein